MQTTLLSLALATLALLPGGDGGLDRLPRDPGPRTEHFVLELAGTTKALPVGSLVLRRRAVPGGFQLEGEWQFDRPDEEGGSERVLHVEQISREGSKLIWRAWGPTRARTLSVARDAGGRELAFVDSGRHATPRGTLAARETAYMPLELLERMRRIADLPAACERFDPLSRSLERVEVRLLPVAAGAASATRTYELARVDGTIAGRFEFLGSDLRSIRWQDGDLVARRVDEQEYRTRAPEAAVTIQRP